MCVCVCVHITVHNSGHKNSSTVLVIFRLILQAIIIDQMLSVGGHGERVMKHSRIILLGYY